MNDKPAFPVPDSHWIDAHERPAAISGLSRRELFVLGMAMAWRTSEAGVEYPMRDGGKTLATLAMEDADALIAELDKDG